MVIYIIEKVKNNMTDHSKLILVSKLSCGISSVVSVIYIVLSILGIIFYFQCNSGEAATQSQLFWSMVYITYLQHSDCNNVENPITGVTQPFTVFVFMTVTLSFAIVHLITSTALFIQISNKEHAKYFNVYVYTYVGSWTATLVVDLTLGTFLGMDISLLAGKLNDTLDNDHETQMVRQGTFQLMTLVLKGFVLYVINFVLIVLLVVYNRDYQTKNEQPLYTSSPLYAYENDNNGIDIEDTTRSDNFYSLSSLSDHFRSPYREMNSQHHTGQLLQAPSQSPRLFSYEAPPKPQPKKKTHPAWPAPNVPAPDYSPDSPRRLKSALKP